MDWKKLQEALWRMKPSGEDGFEGFIARLLSACLDQSFIVARSGTQNSGDCRTVVPGTVVQTKRYSAKTPLSLPEVSYDIDRVSHNTETDLYVLCATRSIDAQLRTELDRKINQTGLDVVCIDFPDEVSPPLGCLCVAYWEILAQFESLRPIHDELALDAREAADTSEVQEAVSRLRKELFHGIRDYHHWQSKTRNRLKQDFYKVDPGAYYPLNLNDNIRRDGCMTKLHDWRKSKESKAIILGEEGMGKSWIAADFAWECCENGILVFWFYSKDWGDAKSIGMLLDKFLSLHRILDSDKAFRDRFERKALQRWREPVLVVLDGVNERGAVEAASRLMEDFNRIDNNPDNRVCLRFLLTSRPLDYYAGYSQSLRQISNRIGVEGFNDEEIERFLAKRQPPIDRERIPAQIRDLARIPRYTELCLRHLGNLPADVTIKREILFWLDLKDRIENRLDPEVRVTLGLNSSANAAQILSHLAIKSREGVVDGSALEEALPNYRDVLNSLCELRIVAAPNFLKTNLTPHIVSLGWALYILEVAKNIDNGTVQDMADLISRELEPAVNADPKSDALRIAAILALYDDNLLGSQYEDVRIAALLFRWVNLNNSNLLDAPSTLQQVYRKHPESYRLFMEAFYGQFQSGLEEDYLLFPLVWGIRENPDDPNLREILERWLLLIYHHNSASNGPTLRYKGHDLPRAETNHQLRLSCIALSVISLSPTEEYLDSLALCLATADASCEDINGEVQKTKRLGDPIAYLMRWGYTEGILNELCDRARDEKRSDIQREGYKRLIRHLRMDDIPEDLRLESPPSPWTTRFVTVQEALIERLPIWDRPEKADYVVMGSSKAHFAAREDLPPLMECDLELVARFFGNLDETELCCFDRRRGSTASSDQMEEYIPILAAFRPEIASKKIVKIHDILIPNNLSYFFLQNVYIGLGTCRPDQQQALVDHGRGIINNSKDNFTSFHIIYLCSYAILNFDMKYLIEWIDMLTSTEGPIESLAVHPNPHLLEIRSDPLLLETARDRIIRNGTSFGRFFPWRIVYVAQQKSYDPGVVEIALQHILSDEFDPENAYWPFALLAASSQEYLWGLLADSPPLRKRLRNNAARAFYFHAHWDSLKANTFSDAMLKEIPDRILAAEFSFRSESTLWLDVLRSFFEIATHLLQTQFSDEPTPNGTPIINMSDEGRLLSKGYFPKVEGGMQHTTGPAWGYDQGTFPGANEDIENKFREDSDTWFRQSEKFEFWEGLKLSVLDWYLMAEKFSQKHPEVFIKIAIDFFRVYDKCLGTVYYCLHPFARAILYHTMPLDSDIFLQQQGILQSPYYTMKIRCGGVEQEYYQAFRTIGTSMALKKWLRDKFLKALNDLNILEIVKAGLHAESEEFLLSFAEEFAMDDNAKNRALAATIYAFMGSETAVASLEKLNSTDPSSWVRYHAKWSLDVCRSEISCRELYKKALVASDEEEAVLILHRIRPALTPLSSVWRRQIEKKTHFCETGSVRRRMVVSRFWGIIERMGKSTVTVYLRDLKKHCRGEKLDSFHSQKMAPWWNPL